MALWDTVRQELLVARDRFGEKPLSYAEHAGDLLFASDLEHPARRWRGLSNVHERE